MPGMRVLIFALVLCLTPLTAFAQQRSIQETLLLVRPAVVLVIAEVAARVRLDCGSGHPIDVAPTPFRETGTGWFVAPNGLIVTNARTVDVAVKPPGWLRDQQIGRAVRSACVDDTPATDDVESSQDRQDVEESVRRLTAAARRDARVLLEPSITIVLASGTSLPATVVKPAASAWTSPLASDLALLWVGLTNAPTLSLGDSTRLKLGDPVHLVGYPAVVLTHELLNRSAPPEPSVTSGAVSGFRQDRTGRALVQTDAPAWGASGGPGVDTRGRLFGMLAFAGATDTDGSEVVQGFNFLVPVAAVRDFLGVGYVDLKAPSRFNTAWRAGLDAFFAGRHSEAAGYFTEADRLLPGLPDVARIAAENDRLGRTVATKRMLWVAGAVIAAAAGASAVVMTVRARRARNSFRVRPAVVARLLESGTPPLIVDARDETTYARSPVRLPRAVHVSLDDLAGGGTTLPAEPARTVVAYCSRTDEETSTRLAHLLHGLGYEDVRILDGGLAAWAIAGLPLEANL